jgi:hypothetical protein
MGLFNSSAVSGGGVEADMHCAGEDMTASELSNFLAVG